MTPTHEPRLEPLRQRLAADGELRQDQLQRMRERADRLEAKVAS